jgi:hypothetical protein
MSLKINTFTNEIRLQSKINKRKHNLKKEEPSLQRRTISKGKLKSKD